MKLHQIINILESESNQAGLDAFLKDAELTRDQITVNQDGSIDVNGSVKLYGNHLKGWPKLNEVNGGFTLFVDGAVTPELFQVFPRIVNGSCSIPLGKNVIHSSQLPRNKAHSELNIMEANKGCGILLDDDTLSTYSTSGGTPLVPIKGGLEFAPRHWKTGVADTINVQIADITGIPPVIECGSFYLDTSSTSIKNIKKHIRTLRVAHLACITFPKNTPLLRLLDLIKNVDTVYLRIKGTDPLKQQLFDFGRTLPRHRELDIFELQELMIENGLGAYAK